MLIIIVCLTLLSYNVNYINNHLNYVDHYRYVYYCHNHTQKTSCQKSCESTLTAHHIMERPARK